MDEEKKVWEILRDMEMRRAEIDKKLALFKKNYLDDDKLKKLPMSAAFSGMLDMQGDLRNLSEEVSDFISMARRELKK